MKDLTLFVFVLLVSAGLAHADEDYVVVDPPSSLKPQPDRALVYFVNFQTMATDTGPSSTGLERDKTIRVLIDDKPVGLLPSKSYTGALIDPGLRLIWRYGSEQWFEFKAGETYWFHLRARAQSPTWFLDNPTILRAEMKKRKVRYTAMSESGLRRISTNLSKKYEKKRRRSRMYLDKALAARKSKDLSEGQHYIGHKTGKPGETGTPGAAVLYRPGRLTIGEDSLTFELFKKKKKKKGEKKKKRKKGETRYMLVPLLEIPLNSIESVSFGGFPARAEMTGAGLFLLAYILAGPSYETFCSFRVHHNESGVPKEAYFGGISTSQPVYGCNQIFSEITNAVKNVK